MGGSLFSGGTYNGINLLLAGQIGATTGAGQSLRANGSTWVSPLPVVTLPHSSINLAPINANLDLSNSSEIRAPYFYPNQALARREPSPTLQASVPVVRSCEQPTRSLLRRPCAEAWGRSASGARTPGRWERPFRSRTRSRDRSASATILLRSRGFTKKRLHQTESCLRRHAR